MSAPRPPLKERLRMPDDEQALARIWSRIDAGDRQGARRGLQVAQRLLRLDRPALAGAVLAVAAALVVWVGISHDDTGPLRLADGQPIAAVQAPPSGAVMAMSDGSRVTLSGGARLEPLLSTADLVRRDAADRARRFRGPSGRTAPLADRVRIGDRRSGRHRLQLHARARAAAGRRPARRRAGPR